MQKRTLTLLFLLAAMPQTLLAANAVKQNPPMIINSGWSTPDPLYLKQNVAEWEALPFTGSDIHIPGKPEPSGGSVKFASPGNLNWFTFKKNFVITAAMLQDFTTELQQTQYTQAQDSFLYFNSYYSMSAEGAVFDWFDDVRWADVLTNAENLARHAKDGGLRGMRFDFEEYGSPKWSYQEARVEFSLNSYATYAGKTWEQVRDKVRERGRSFIQAVNAGFPGSLFWLFQGYSGGVPSPTYPDNPPPNFLATKQSGLIKGFIDGMLEASDANTIFVDGSEGSYMFSELQEFLDMRQAVTQKALAYTMVPAIYQEKMRVGFGLYLDMSQGTWDSNNPQNNLMPPARLEKALRNALQVSDGYVWIYSEFPSWWLTSPGDNFGINVRSRTDHEWIDPVYIQAVENAIVSADNLAAVFKPAGMFDGGLTHDDAIALTLNDGVVDSFDGCFMYMHDPTFIPINAMGYDLAGSVAVESVVVKQENLLTDGTPGRERLKDVRVYYLGGFQDFLNVPNQNEITLVLGGINTTYLMIKALDITNNGLSDVLDIREIEVYSAVGRMIQTSATYLPGVSVTFQGAGWLNAAAILNDGYLAAIRQFSNSRVVKGAGLLSGDTINYNLGSPVSFLARVGIGQSGMSSTGAPTGLNDFIETLTLEFATDPAFTNIISTQSVTLIDQLPYQQATFTPVTAQYVRVGASSLFSKAGSNRVALSELQLYQNSVTNPTTCNEVFARGYGSIADLDRDCYVRLTDFDLFVSQWLYCMDPQDVTCDDPWNK